MWLYNGLTFGCDEYHVVGVFFSYLNHREISLVLTHSFGIFVDGSFSRGVPSEVEFMYALAICEQTARPWVWELKRKSCSFQDKLDVYYMYDWTETA